MIDNKFSKHLISFVIVSFLIAAAPAIFIKEWLKKLFPRIEIQTGKNFHQIKKEKTQKIIDNSFSNINSGYHFLLASSNNKLKKRVASCHFQVLSFKVRLPHGCENFFKTPLSKIEVLPFSINPLILIGPDYMEADTFHQ